jgi:hypothetical protein
MSKKQESTESLVFWVIEFLQGGQSWDDFMKFLETERRAGRIGWWSVNQATRLHKCYRYQHPLLRNQMEKEA